jgi:hypothetical protein
MDPSCAVFLIAAVAGTGDVGVKVAREIVSVSPAAHGGCELGWLASVRPGPGEGCHPSLPGC